MSDLFDKCRTDAGYFGAFRARKDMYFSQPVLEGRVGPRMKFQGRDVIVWAINNYLGIAGRSELAAAASGAIAAYGPSAPMGSRLLTGNSNEHIALESHFASFCRKPASLVFNYGYLGVLGTVTALVDRDDVVVIDSLSHASMIDATVLASAGRRFHPFKHNDMDDLESHLRAAHKDRKGGILIITEGVFGMKGDLAKLPEICRLKEKYGARLFVDDAHGFGVMGAGGRGTGEHLGVQAGIDLYFGTFAKAFAAMQGHAVSNAVPVVAANRIGIEENDGAMQKFYGHSFIADHRGEIVASFGETEEGVLVASFDLAEIATYRAEWGFFRDRRTDLYAKSIL